MASLESLLFAKEGPRTHIFAVCVPGVFRHLSGKKSADGQVPSHWRLGKRVDYSNDWILGGVTHGMVRCLTCGCWDKQDFSYAPRTDIALGSKVQSDGL